MFRNPWRTMNEARNQASVIMYDGLLSAEMSSHIRDMSKKYPYAVEVCCENFPWDDFHNFLPKHMYHQENDPGLEPHERTSCLFGILSKDICNPKANRFFFLINEEERQMFIDEFHSHIIDVNPFKMEIAV